ncbi:MAG TPA: type III pantothenate kinase [Gallionella sp.]|nr:type III pantothenate kinase [Gallionella sp.]
MRLLIDAGNTRIKWALADEVAQLAQVTDECWLFHGDLPTLQASQLSQEIAGRLARRNTGENLHDIKQIWVSNVAGEEIAHRIRSMASGLAVPVNFAGARQAQCGVRNGYASISQLGSDRWASLISAWHMVKGKCLVVNSGTATTIDSLSGQGEFVGGLILPGVDLMQRSLVEATDQLKSSQGEYVPFPLNTADAIYSGAIQAICGAIERQYILLDDADAPVVLSGGDAALLKPYLDQNQSMARLLVVDNLVLRGLLVMAQEDNFR